MDNCPVCTSKAIFYNQMGEDYERYHSVECDRCGKFFIGVMLTELLSQDDEDELWKVSHWIRKNQRDSVDLYINNENLDSIINEVVVPKPHEKCDLFIKWIGDALKSDEDIIEIRPSFIASRICTKDQNGVLYIIMHLINMGLVESLINIDLLGIFFKDDNEIEIGLTFDGWERYHEITHKGIFSKKAFMAMAYTDKMMSLYQDHFQDAVKQTGFDLVVLDKELQAGLIDDQLRVQILNSRFLLADLTHGNNGAYWEAGYAEGLGKPVIYLCEKTAFEDEKSRPHFDTNHLVTVIWDENNIDNAMEKLKATIRLTFPEDAKMTDDN